MQEQGQVLKSIFGLIQNSVPQLFRLPTVSAPSKLGSGWRSFRPILATPLDQEKEGFIFYLIYILETTFGDVTFACKEITKITQTINNLNPSNKLKLLLDTCN